MQPTGLKTPYLELLPPLDRDALEALQASISAEGVRDPLVVTEDGVLLDGHNRLAIAGDDAPTHVIPGSGEWSDAQRRAYILRNQDARRTLDRQQRQALDRVRRQVCWELNQEGWRQAAIAEFLGITRSRVSQLLRDTSTSIVSPNNTCTPRDQRERIPDDARAEIVDRVEAGESQVSVAEDVGISQQRVNQIVSAARNSSSTSKPHISNNSGCNEWYTPPEYLDAVRRVLGHIDLDPASSPVAQRAVQAKGYFTEEQDGLKRKWKGRVFLNPPYSVDLIPQFAARLVESYTGGAVTAAVLLVNNATETKWFQRAACAASAVCFPIGRIKYLDATGQPKNTPLQGQAFLYFGEDGHRFVEEFEQFGIVLVNLNGDS